MMVPVSPIPPLPLPDEATLEQQQEYEQNVAHYRAALLAHHRQLDQKMRCMAVSAIALLFGGIGTLIVLVNLALA